MDIIREKTGDALICFPKNTKPERLIVLCCGDEAEEMMPELFKGMDRESPFMIVSPQPVSWDRDYTPWPSEELTGRTLSGGAPVYYRRLIDEILPSIVSRYPAVRSMGIAGYSLGGLFALWAALQSDSPFECAASVSGALWYEGFVPFAEAADASSLKRVYLSLGKKEAKVGRGAMSRVSDATSSLQSLFADRFGEENAFFEWNNGNHFFEVPQRISKAIHWICKLKI